MGAPTPGITRREAEVLAALGDRLTNAEIAARLYVSHRTVESHVSSLLRKLEASDRRELAVRAQELSRSAPDAPSLPGAFELLARADSHVGRDDEGRRLGEQWERAADGHLTVAVVTGEAGIGKTRLVAELTAGLPSGEIRIVLGSCFEDGRVPYQPFAQVLAADARDLSSDELRRCVGPDARALARLAPQIGDRLQLESNPATVDLTAERAEVASALHGYICRSAEALPLVLALEDLHWATTSTRDAVLHLARVGGRAPVLIVVTARDTAPELDDSLAVFLADAVRLPNVEHIELAGLDEPSVRCLLEQSASRADPATVRSDTGGNPLFVQEIARRDVPTGSGSLHGLLTRRYALLDDEALTVLDVAATIGTEFDAGFLASCVDRSVTDVVRALESAEAAGLTAPTPRRPGHFSFVHALIRSARYESLPRGRRRELHRQVVVALEARADDESAMSELARHACLSAPLTDPRLAVDYAVRAGDLAERSLGLDEAANHYRAGLAALDLVDAPDDLARLLRIRLGGVLAHAGDPDGRASLRAAAIVALRVGHPRELAAIAEAVVHYGGTTTPGKLDPEFQAVAEGALSAMGAEPTAARARVLALLATHVGVGSDPERGFELASEALSIARTLNDPATLGQVLLAHRYVGGAPPTPRDRAAVAEELIALGRREDQPIFSILGTLARAWSLREAGAIAAHGQAIDDAAALLGNRPIAYPRLGVALHQGIRQVLSGDLEGAEASFGALSELAVAAGMEPVAFCGPLFNTIRHNQGRVGELVGIIEAAVADQPGFSGAYEAALAIAYAHAGRLDAAGETIQRWATDDFARVQRNLSWSSALVMFCEVAELTGNSSAAACLTTRLTPLSGLIADNGASVRAPIDLALAQAALTTGDSPEAERLADKAAADSRRRNTPIFLGRELLRLAEARRRLGAPPQHTELLVDEAMAIAHRTGAGLIVAEARWYGLEPSR